MKLSSFVAAAAVTALVVSARAQQPPSQTQTRKPDEPTVRFRSGVEVINVTATVSDATGRFVPGLTRDDFVVYDDDQRVEITHFSPERVPVSLGIALDTSGSMFGEKMDAARGAIRRFVNELLEQNDELFLYRFSNYPVLVQGWTRDRRDLLEPLDRLTPNGATAMYDAVARAIPLAEQGQNLKKALVVISDGNDTSSRIDIRELKQQIRESEVLVYAVGIDAEDGERHRGAVNLAFVRVAVAQQHELLEHEEGEDAEKERAEDGGRAQRFERFRQQGEERDTQQRADGVADQPWDETCSNALGHEQQ